MVGAALVDMLEDALGKVGIMEDLTEGRQRLVGSDNDCGERETGPTVLEGP